jgi:hypothetical protein
VKVTKASLVTMLLEAGEENAAVLVSRRDRNRGRDRPTQTL